MEGKVLIGVLLGLLGAVFLNLGKGFEKMKVRVFAQGWNMFKMPHIKDLGVWCIGLCMTASYGVFLWAAMNFVNNPSLIVAMSGFGLVALVLFAVRVIGEKVTKREIIGIGIIVVATVTMPLFQSPKQEQTHFNMLNLIIGGGLPLIFFGVLSVISLYTRKMHGFSFGGLAGACNSIPSILTKISWVVVGANASVLEQLKYPYLYVAMVVGIGATVFTQLGFWRDRAIIVVPTFVSFNIVIPAVLEYFVFGVALNPIQYVAMAVIIGGVIFLSLSTSEEVLAVDVDEKA